MQIQEVISQTAVWLNCIKTWENFCLLSQSTVLRNLALKYQGRKPGKKTDDKRTHYVHLTNL